MSLEDTVHKYKYKGSYHPNSLIIMYGGRKGPKESATLFKIGYKAIGLDGNEWIIIKNKNGIKRWKLHKKIDIIDTKKKKEIKTTEEDTSPLDLYNVEFVSQKKFWRIVETFDRKHKSLIKLIQKTFLKLQKHGFSTAVVPRPESQNGVLWADYAVDYIKHAINPKFFDNDKFIYVTVNLDVGGDHMHEYINDKDLFEFASALVGNYSYLDVEGKKEMIKVFQKEMPYHFVWSGKNTEGITFPFKKTKPTKIDLTKLKNNDQYPELYITIHFRHKKEKINLLNDSSLLDKIAKELKNAIYDSRDDFHDMTYGSSDGDLTFYGITKYKEKGEKALNILLKHKDWIYKADITYYTDNENGGKIKTTLKMFK